VHRGHQALIGEVKAAASRRGAAAGVMVFEPHPREFFAPGRPVFRLTTLDQKLRLLAAAGLDQVVILKFDAGLAGMPARRFVEEVLVAGLGVSHVVVGFDFFFGKNRTGTPQVMAALGRELGFGVSILDPVAEAGETFSSSAIRERLSEGDVAGAAAMLGHYWRISGVVTGGAQRGTGMGYPTANLRLAPGTALGHGIYAVRVYVDGERHHGAAYLGRRPTFDNGAVVLETFLLDFSGDLYGKPIEVEFVGFVRPDQAFPSVEALTAQMAKDCAAAEQMLKEADARQTSG